MRQWSLVATRIVAVIINVVKGQIVSVGEDLRGHIPRVDETPAGAVHHNVIVGRDTPIRPTTQDNTVEEKPEITMVDRVIEHFQIG